LFPHIVGLFFNFYYKDASKKAINLKKGKSMKFLAILLLTILVSIQAQELKQKPEKDSEFLEIKVDNPDLQAEIDNLKKQYDSELNELKVQFKEQKKS
jgi:hypothetical protein